MQTRLIKELRTLVPPASLVVAPTAWSLLWSAIGASNHTVSRLSEQLMVVAFVVGVPVVAATAFGAEFHHRTLTLLLTQPARRSRIWLEKMLVLAGVVGLLGVIQLAAPPGRLLDVGVADAVMFFTAVVCSAPFWTLIARSTVGGMAFTGGAIWIAELAAEYAIDVVSGRPLEFGLHHATAPLVAARITYCLLMLWLGWRAFKNVETRDSAETTLVNAATWPMLRCTPTGPLRNLIKKEAALQRPTYQIAGLFTICWLGTLALFLVSRPAGQIVEGTFGFLLAMYLPVAIVIAGTISIGDDTTLGLRAWHLTLPVSSAAQWTVKFAVSLLAGGALAIALPIGLVSVTVAVLPLEVDMLRALARPVAAVTAGAALALSFWASTLYGQTVRAAIGVGLTAIALMFCTPLAVWAGERFTGGTGILTALMVTFHWPPDALDAFLAEPAWALPGYFVVVATLALLQSLAAFRRIQSDPWTITRHTAALVGSSLLFVAFFAALGTATYRQRFSTPVRELQIALSTLPARPAAGADPRSVSLDELDATGRLSATTKSWLTGADISVKSWGKPGSSQATVRFPNSRKYLMVYSSDPLR